MLTNTALFCTGILHQDIYLVLGNFLRLNMTERRPVRGGQTIEVYKGKMARIPGFILDSVFNPPSPSLYVYMFICL